jgi:hypothetical protein
MGGPSPEKGRGNRHQPQIDTMQNRRETLMRQALLRSSFGKLRTVVCLPNARQATIANAGHLIEFEQLDAFARTVMQFIAST